MSDLAIQPQDLGIGRLFEKTRDAVIVADAQTQRIVLWNLAAEKMFGYSSSEALELRVEALVPESLRAQHRAGIARYAQTGHGPYIDSHRPLELPALRKGGKRIYVELLLSPIGPVGDTDGSECFVLAIVRDITERKRAEEETRRLNENLEKRVAERTAQLEVAFAKLEERERELREGEERYRAVVEQAAEGIFLVDVDTKRILEANAAYQNLLGYASEEILQLTLYDVVPYSREDMDCYIQRVLGQRSNVSGEWRHRRKDGSLVDVEVSANLISYSGRRVICIVARDITERKRTEEALRESEELYRTVVEQAAENIFLVDAETKRILQANAALYASLGYTAEELRQMTLYDIVAHDQESSDQNIRGIIEERRHLTGERVYRRKDGSLVNVEVNASIVSYKDRKAICIVAHEITERKRAEENLRQSLSVMLALREAGQILGSTLESEEIISRLLQIMRSVSNLDATVISMQDEKGDLRVWRSAGLEQLPHRIRYTPETEAARWAALENEEQRLFRVQRSDPEAEPLVGLCLPLRVRDRVVGVLEAYGPESLAEDEIAEILGSLTSQAASALENAWLYGELAERERRLQHLVGKLLGAQEEERRRVAYEVHDALAQVAVAAHQHLQAFSRRHPPDTERSRRDLEQVSRLVRQTVSDARKIIANLRPTVLDDFGLEAAVSLEVERLRQDSYQVDYAGELGDERLPTTAEIALFRIVQEALTNVRKHAQTRRVSIELRRRGDKVYLEVRDFGRGFDPTAAPVESGPGERVGLVGMRERVGMLGGTLKVRSQPGAGTSITVEIPLPATN